MIYEDINEKIEQYPSHQMSSIKLVRVYAETLLSNIHEHIVNNVSKLVKNKILNGIDKLAQLGYIDLQNNIELNNQSVDNQTVKIEEIETETVNCNVPKIEEIEYNVVKTFETKTFDSFIDTLKINEIYNINT